MTRARTLAAGAAALGAAVLVFAAWALPPAARALPSPAWRPAGHVVRGAFHVHTVRSDGTGTVDEVAAAAARAGLQFVVFTDHGDGTRRADAASYRSGVLCLDAVEISTDGGHYGAIGLEGTAYPLGGEPRDVVEDVSRLGGFGVATHPDSPKPGAAWRGWDAPIDALEWLNADTEWRTSPPRRLALAVFTYPVRAPETLAALFRRPAMLARWDALAARRRVVALAGADAHARIGWKGEESTSGEERGRTLLRFPSYEASFRAFSLHVTLDARFSGRADEDAGRLVTAIRRGHLHTIIDGFARNGAFEFTARSGPVVAGEGDRIAPAEAVILRVRANVPAGGALVLFRDGREVDRASAPELVLATNRPGTYRAEAWLSAGEGVMPWAVSNPIFVGSDEAPGEGQANTAPAGGAAEAAAIGAEQDWHPEHEPTSAGEVARQGDAVSFEYRLGSGPGRSQFAALSHHGSLPPTTTALRFRGTAAGPMRLSVQLRVQPGSRGERWRRSVYLDATPRDITVPVADLRPAGQTSSPSPTVGAVTSVLFVVDRTNAAAGAAGRFTIEKLAALGPAVEKIP